MKQYLKLKQNFLLLATYLLASTVLGISPSRAATLASSEGYLEFTNFSHFAESVSTNAITNTLSIGQGSSVFTQADATSLFFNDPAEGSNETSTLAIGENQNYFGIAESLAEVVGIFNVGAGETFSFDFLGYLALAIAVDDPVGETASASGDILFALLDITNDELTLLDTFLLAGNLTTQGDNNFITTLFNDDESLDILDIDSQGTAITASAGGSVQRYFSDPARLSLVGINRNQAVVAVPEPSNYLATLFIFGLMVFVVIKRRRAKNLATVLAVKQGESNN
jgi:hypothetical protein